MNEISNLRTSEVLVQKALDELSEAGILNEDALDKVMDFFEEWFECEVEELERKYAGMIPKDLEYEGIGTHHKHWTHIDIRILTSMVRAGSSVAEIAKKLHRTEKAVLAKVERIAPLEALGRSEEIIPLLDDFQDEHGEPVALPAPEPKCEGGCATIGAEKEQTLARFVHEAMDHLGGKSSLHDLYREVAMLSGKDDANGGFRGAVRGIVQRDPRFKRLGWGIYGFD
jgi:hypothetical protein